uniref:Uncharacterized protein n=1 Tax=Palpitomonas bilix TaxID=652834 RepID=A0A7S3GBY0_9EUKA|mmetsp:Transcript_39202/g.100440  ORF Transcript_39202/g.100440 Transcript_39202/m.100440 type:complete len:360 (+) Transcript_39202:430-1509(+)
MPLVEKDLQHTVEDSPLNYSHIFRSVVDRSRPEGYIVETTKPSYRHLGPGSYDRKDLSQDVSTSPLKYSRSMKSSIDRFDNRFTAQPPTETALVKNSHLGPGAYELVGGASEEGGAERLPSPKSASPKNQRAVSPPANSSSWVFRSGSSRFAPENKFKQTVTQIATHYNPEIEKEDVMRKTHTFAKTARFPSYKENPRKRRESHQGRLRSSRSMPETADEKGKAAAKSSSLSLKIGTDTPQRYSGAFRSKVDRFDVKYSPSPVPFTHRLNNVGPGAYKPDKAEKVVTGSGRSNAAASCVFKSATPKLQYGPPGRKGSALSKLMGTGADDTYSSTDRDKKDWTGSGFAWSTSMRFKYDMY